MTTAGVADGTELERRAPGRPRNAQADQAILDAVLAMLSSGQSADAVSIEAVAAKAGVGKATIYRRWANKEALFVDALASMKGPLPELAGVSVREDLISLVNAMRTKRSEDYSMATVCLLPAISASPEMHRMHQAVTAPRRDAIRQVLKRGVANGELRADLDIEFTMLMISGPSIAQNMLQWNPELDTTDFAERLVDGLLRGMAPC